MGNKGSKLKLIAICFVLLLMIVAFQNCSQPVQNDTGVSALASEAAKIDFSYDASLDQIGYMSCSTMNPGTYDNSAYFTIRAGAYKGAGLTLTDSFFNSMAKKAPEKMAELLTESPANTSTIMQLAVRTLDNYQSIETSGTSTPQEGQDYANLLSELGTSDMNTALVNLPSGQRLRYLRDGGTPWGARMEGSLHFTANAGLAEYLRNRLRNYSFLGLTFSQAPTSGDMSNQPYLARSPADVYEDTSIDVRKIVYGRGFKLRFGQPAVTSLHSNFPQVALREVTEFDLRSSTNRNGLGTWSCPNSLQLRIVRGTDLSKPGANCRKIPDPATLSTELTIVRNILRPEDWWVDLENRCIIPKKPGPDCYGDLKTVVYNLGESCNTNADNVCTAYASICYRTR